MDYDGLIKNYVKLYSFYVDFFVWIMCIIYSIYLNINNQPVEEKCGKTINNSSAINFPFAKSSDKFKIIVKPMH